MTRDVNSVAYGPEAEGHKREDGRRAIPVNKSGNQSGNQSGNKSGAVRRIRRVARRLVLAILAVIGLWTSPSPILGQDKEGGGVDGPRGVATISDYFEKKTREIAGRNLAEIQSAEDWQKNRQLYRRRLLEMLGLSPMPQKTELQPVVTGQVERDQFVVEKLHFQSRPGLYVTGNLYRPKEVNAPLPAVLYVCGHGQVKKDGVSYGNKVHYQHHGAWFARNGYVCLVIDTLQLGEIEGIHHGTYRHDRWWWFNRGYTPAGVEAWNCVRALDYLETRPEVDADKMGVTGRSGGGAYSWWIAAIDDRIQCAAPVAGITDLQNHVVDGCVEGHCDCMYMVNTYGWDYSKVAALVSPRPLLICNTDSDGIFPLDGVMRIFNDVRRIYSLQGAADQVGLAVTPGGHRDTQELRVPVFRWFNQHLKGDDSLIEKTAVKFFEPEELKVFDELPDDEINTSIDERFVPSADPELPGSKGEWKALRQNWLGKLRQRVFGGWPSDGGGPQGKTRDVALQPAFNVVRGGVRLRAVDLANGALGDLRLYIVERSELEDRDLIVLKVLDHQGWGEFLATMQVGFEDQLSSFDLPEADADSFLKLRKMLQRSDSAIAYVAPRGIGPNAWHAEGETDNHDRRRFYLLGQTLDSMRVWDVKQAATALRELEVHAEVPLSLHAHRRMAGIALYASLFTPGVQRLELHDLSATHRQGPYFLNVTRFFDIPQAVALVAEKTRVRLYSDDEQAWAYPQSVLETLGWDEDQLDIRSK